MMLPLLPRQPMMPGQLPGQPDPMGGPIPGAMPGAPPQPDPMARQIAQLKLLDQMNDGLPVGTTTPTAAAPLQGDSIRRRGM